MLFLASPLAAQDWLTAYNNSVTLYNDDNASKPLSEANRSEYQTGAEHYNLALSRMADTHLN